MARETLFTIGHSNRTIEEFVALLIENEITALADVRSHPYSRHNPQFNREELKKTLSMNCIQYAFLGAELGARRNEPECYDGGKARYDLIARSAMFESGMERIRRGVNSYRVAIMCAERDPLTCHRMILVCRHVKSGEHIRHILGCNEIEDHADAERRLLKLVGLAPNDLFQSLDELIDHAYDVQADKIAYCVAGESIPTVSPDESDWQ